MAAEIRYTGSWPPPKILDAYSNWVFALDEEIVAGQDETTIKPEDQQTYISETTQFTAADLIFADGTSQVGVLEVEKTRPLRIEGFDGREWWAFQRVSNRWRPVAEDWLPIDERRPVLAMNNQNVFPMRVRSRLCTSTGDQLAFTIYPDGTSH